jgi:hypothetical protein
LKERKVTIDDSDRDLFVATKTLVDKTWGRLCGIGTGHEEMSDEFWDHYTTMLVKKARCLQTTSTNDGAIHISFPPMPILTRIKVLALQRHYIKKALHQRRIDNKVTDDTEQEYYDEK